MRLCKFSKRSSYNTVRSNKVTSMSVRDVLDDWQAELEWHNKNTAPKDRQFLLRFPDTMHVAYWVKAGKWEKYGEGYWHLSGCGSVTGDIETDLEEWTWRDIYL